MGKSAEYRNSQLRMTQFNLKKFNERQIYFETIEIENKILKQENKLLNNCNEEIMKVNEKLLNNSIQEVELALNSQKDQLNKRHKSILRSYLKNIKEKYKQNFDTMIYLYITEIKN